MFHNSMEESFVLRLSFAQKPKENDILHNQQVKQTSGLYNIQLPVSLPCSAILSAVSLSYPNICISLYLHIHILHFYLHRCAFYRSIVHKCWRRKCSFCVIFFIHMIKTKLNNKITFMKLIIIIERYRESVDFSLLSPAQRAFLLNVI